MSWEACSWAVKQQVVTDPTARHILLCMANRADREGTDSHPSASQLNRETGLAIRTIRLKIQHLLETGAIRYGDQRVVEIKFPRPDRRPVNYDLALENIGVQTSHPVIERGANDGKNGVHLKDERGAPHAPNTVLLLPIDTVEPPIVPQGGRMAKPQPIIGQGKYSREFEDFWDDWPKGKGGTKAKAYKAWLKLKLDDADKQAERTKLHYDVQQRKAYHRPWQEDVVCHVATYLNGQGWTADIDTSTGPKKYERAQTSYERFTEASERGRAQIRSEYEALSPDEQREYREAFGHQ